MRMIFVVSSRPASSRSLYHELRRWRAKDDYDNLRAVAGRRHLAPGRILSIIPEAVAAITITGIDIALHVAANSPFEAS